MVLRKSIELSHNFTRKVDALEITRKRMDRLFNERKIFRNDIEHVYEGMYLKAITAFESYIEELFVGILHDKYKLPSRKRVTKVLFDNKFTALDIIFFGQPYVDWMPYKKLKDRAELFYKNGEPFTILDETEKGLLTQVVSIRNAIAHKSSFAQKKFYSQVIEGVPGIPEQNKSPAGFLRYVFRIAPDQTKFENYMLELSRITSKISSYR